MLSELLQTETLLTFIKQTERVKHSTMLTENSRRKIMSKHMPEKYVKSISKLI